MLRSCDRIGGCADGLRFGSTDFFHFSANSEKLAIGLGRRTREGWELMFDLSFVMRVRPIVLANGLQQADSPPAPEPNGKGGQC